MAAELRKSPRPGSLFDPSSLPPPPLPPPAAPDAVNPSEPKSPTQVASPKTSWGVKPTAQRGLAPSQSQRAVVSPPPEGHAAPLRTSQPILSADARKDSTGASSPVAQLSQSQVVGRSQAPMASYTSPPPSQYRPLSGLDEKMLRSPSAPVLNPVAPSSEDGGTRARATLPTKALPPVPMIAKEASTGKEPSAPNRVSANSTSLVSASTPSVHSQATPGAITHSASSPQMPTSNEERSSNGSLRSLEIAGDTPDTEQNILYGEAQPGQPRILRAATPTKLIEKLSNPAYDAAFTLDCIVTYPLYCISSNEFLDALVLRYQNVQNLACRRKIINEIIRMWIEVNFDWSVESNVRAFLQTVRNARNADSSVVPELFDLIDRMSRRMREGYNTFSAPPPDQKPMKPLMPKDMSKVHTIEDIHPKEMARQITLLASDIYKKIRVSELLKQAWSKKDKEKNAPNVLHLINRFNKTSLWVASMCVLPETVPARASTISYFIKVAKEMREIRNFDGMIAIINGLENSSVLRLKQSWAFVEGKADLQTVKDMMTFDGNYKAYREHLASLDATEPAVPFIAPFLGDLTFIDENPNQINGLWNFGKCRMISRSIQVALKFQKLDYPFEPVAMVQKYLSKIRMPEEQDIYEVSIKREKKGEEDKAASIMVETLFS